MKAYLIHRHGGVRRMVVDALEVAVGLIINLLTKVLVSLRPHLRKVSYTHTNTYFRNHTRHFLMPFPLLV